MKPTNPNHIFKIRQGKLENNIRQYNFDKPFFDNDEAAAFLNCAPNTLRISRHRGKLFTRKAPPYKKRGGSIVYAKDSLIEWESQFAERNNTAEQ